MDASQQAQRNTVPVIKVLAICPGSQRRRSCGAGEQGAAVAKQGLFKEYWNIPNECFNVQSSNVISVGLDCDVDKRAGKEEQKEHGQKGGRSFIDAMLNNTNSITSNFNSPRAERARGNGANTKT